MIQKISAEDLKKMQDREGLVLQGCGGDLREWEDGIHQMLAEEKILQNGAHFKEIYAFEHDGCTNLLFMMDGIELDTGRLVLWRLRTHAQFGGTWLSDYLPNRLGVEETVWDGKPDCPLIGANGNIFNLMGIAARTLAENDQNDEAKEMCRRVIQCGSYDAALGVIGEYVNIVSVPFPVSWTVKMKKKQKETQDILSYHTQAAGCSDKARAKASGGRQPIEECGRTGL